VSSPSGVVVPFLDVRAATAEVRGELDEAFARVLDSGWFLLGDELAAFEAAWAAYAGAEHCVAVGSGLDALRLGLEAHGIGPGDEVLVPGQTFIATWLAVSATGAEPVPVDVDPARHSLDPDAAAAAVGERTAAILPVDLYGQPADHVALGALADRHGLLLFDDAAQAHGARLHGRPVATHSAAAAWSFYPGKNLGALGDGGALTTDDAEIAARVRRLRNYGSQRRYEHIEPGINSRLDELQAAVLRVKLHVLDDWNARRAAIAQRYLDALAPTPLRPLEVLAGAEPSWHLFPVCCDRRDALRAHLEAAGVQTLIHYPLPPHRQGAYAGTRAAEARLPVSDAIAASVLSLPIGPHMRDDQVDRVIEAVAGFG
jgi:dTDP-3-amino-3,4,6-trideoxy-alpha-D-glucose transaminase